MKETLFLLYASKRRSVCFPELTLSKNLALKVLEKTEVLPSLRANLTPAEGETQNVGTVYDYDKALESLKCFVCFYLIFGKVHRSEMQMIINARLTDTALIKGINHYERDITAIGNYDKTIRVKA